MQAQRILLAGSYGHGNTGDEAILAALLDRLRARLPALGCSVVAGDTAAVAARHGVEAIPWTDWRRIAGATARADLVILGGGGLFFDYWGFDPRALLESAAPDLAHFASFPLLAWLYDRPFMVCACGVGPLFTPRGREMVRLTYSLAARATVRDTESKALLEELGVPGERIRVTADPAFALPVAGEHRAREILAAHGVRQDRPLVALAPRPWELSGPQQDWEARLADALAALATGHDLQVLLIPFHGGFDEPSLLRLAARLEERLPGAVHRLVSGLPPEEIAAVIGCCDLLIGVRLHAILFALVTGSPVVALAYDPKVRHLMRGAGQEDLCLDLTDLGELEQVLAAGWQRRQELRREVLAASLRLRSAAEDNVEMICSLLAGGGVPSRAPEADLGRAFRGLVARALEGRLEEIAAHGLGLDESLRRSRAQASLLEDENAELQRQLASRAAELEGIHRTKVWRLMTPYWSLRRRLRWQHR